MSDNIIPFRNRGEVKKQRNDNTTPMESLEQVAEKNRLNQERLKAERLADTKKVLKSYRIK